MKEIQKVEDPCNIHIGSKIASVLSNRGMTQNTLSVLVNTSASNIARITQRKNVEVHMLYKISKALKHNFFKHFPVVEEEQPAEKDKVVEELNAKIASLEKQAQSDNIE